MGNQIGGRTALQPRNRCGGIQSGQVRRPTSNARQSSHPTSRAGRFLRSLSRRGRAPSVKTVRSSSQGPASPCSSRSTSRSTSPGSPRFGVQRWSHQNALHPRGIGGLFLHEEPFSRLTYSFADDAPIERAEAPPQPEEETIAVGPLTLSTRLEYTSLKKGEAHNVFALVSLQAAEAKTPGSDDASAAMNVSDRPPMDITCVLDVSGSMTGDKVQLVKDAVMFVIDEMLPGDRLSIVSFNHDAQRHTALTRMDVSGKDAASQATLRLTAGGGTSIAAGLDCGIQVMEQRRQRSAVGAIFLLTDGQDETSPAQVQELVTRARAAHCGVYAFGFGEDHDTSTLSCIAEAAQTPFTYVEKPDTIKCAFAGAVGGLMSVVAQNIELRIMPDEGCTLTSLHTHFTSRRDDGHGGAAVVSIPDAFAGERRDVVIELCVSADSADGLAPLLRTSATYRAVSERTSVQMPEVFLYAERTAEPEGEPDEEVTTQRQRIEVTNALEQAISQGGRGQFEEAQSMLDQNIRKLRSTPAQNEVSKALLAELNDAHCRLSSAAAWDKGGHAELADAMWMHRNQRCTNMTESASNLVQKHSKQLYLRGAQKCSISRCSA